MVPVVELVPDLVEDAHVLTSFVVLAWTSADLAAVSEVDDGLLAPVWVVDFLGLVDAAHRANTRLRVSNRLDAY
jgi:hypothetical protein